MIDVELGNEQPLSPRRKLAFQRTFVQGYTTLALVALFCFLLRSALTRQATSAETPL
jgi:hypothetical protein